MIQFFTALIYFAIVVFTFIYCGGLLYDILLLNKLTKISQTGIISSKLKRIGDFNTPYRPIYNPEELTKSDFCKRAIAKGKYGGNINKYEHVIYTCPKCNTAHELVFEHGDTVKCNCGLYAQTYGNSLRVWTQ